MSTLSCFKQEDMFFEGEWENDEIARFRFDGHENDRINPWVRSISCLLNSSLKGNTQDGKTHLWHRDGVRLHGARSICRDFRRDCRAG